MPQANKDRAIAHAKEMAEQDAAKAEGRDPRTAAALVDDLDDLLEEIDTILEDQQQLTNFRQKGGQ